MCELFGVSSPEKIELNEMLRTFFSHGTEHPHGWGMAFFYGNGVSVEKEPVASFKSEYLKHRLRYRIEADQMLAHIRLATRGSMDYENTHPFVIRDCDGRAWTLIHNGTIFECDVLRKYVHKQEGKTDSERILLYLVDRMNQARREKGNSLSLKERFSVADEVLCEITPENKINLLLFDGELLYAHTNFKNSLHICRKGKAEIISTEPLDFDSWEDLPLNQLLAFKEGELAFRGTNHGNEFFATEEKMRLLFLDFAGL